MGKRWVMALAALMAAGTASGQGWVSIGPEGGPVLEVRSAEGSPATAWAATETGGLFKSGDGGRTWRPIGMGLGSLAITLLEQEPGNPAVLYAGTGASTEAGTGLFRSTNGGESWQRVPYPGDESAPISLSIPPYDPRTLYLLPAGLNSAGTGLRSTDRGQTWERIITDIPPNERISLMIAADPHQEGRVFFAPQSVEGGSLFRSNDSGETFTELIRPGLFVNLAEFDSEVPGTIYFGGPRLIVTEDAGTNLTIVDDVGRPSDVLVDAREPDRILVGRGTGLQRSDDRGETWTSSTIGTEEMVVWDLEARSNSPDSLLAGTSRGVFRSSDGGESWNRSIRGLVASQITSLAVDPSSRVLLASSANSGIYRSEDLGRTWHLVIEGAPNHSLDFLETDQAGHFYATGARAFYKSTDGGLTWVQPNNELIARGPETVVVDPSVQGRVYVASSLRLYRSDDYGETFPQATSCPSACRNLAIAGDDPQTLYAVIGTLRKSVDAGASFSEVGSFPSSLGRLVVIDPENSDVVYVVATDGIFRSTDDGATWELRGPGPPPDEPILKIVVDPVDGALLGATRNRLYRSQDGGATWSLYDSGLPPIRVEAIEIASTSPSRIYLATEGKGAFVLDRGLPEPCVAGDRTLCLNDGRFRVEASWRTGSGDSGAAQAEPLTADTGYFWFFNSNNIELIVKVLDACTFGSRFWVFAGGLTNVEVDLVVTDSQTGAQKVYRNDQGTPFAPLQDTNAFATCP